MPFDLQHIVCAVDFSPRTPGVVHRGDLLARTFGARLSVLHAVSASRDRYPGTTIYARGGQRRDLLEAARRRLEELVAPLEDAAAVAATGDPVEALIAYDREHPFDLVVAARYGLSGLQRVLLGSVVERLARRLNKPLMVVGRDRTANTEAEGWQRIVAACRAGETSPQVFTAAATLARCFDARLCVLHAVEQPVMEGMVEPTDGPYGQVQAELQDRLHREMERLARQEAPDRAVAVHLAPGPAAEVLPRFIARQPADLVVVGVRPRRRFEQLLIGSTTEAALRHTNCTVLTVPSTRSGREERPASPW